MLQDILQHEQTTVIDKKKYSFEYNYEALAALQKETGKSPYEIYDTVVEDKKLMIEESVSIVCCGLLKHHTPTEIMELKQKLKDRPGLWNSLKDAVVTSFILPMLPPEVLMKLEEQETLREKKGIKKKAVMRKKKQSSTGSKTS